MKKLVFTIAIMLGFTVCVVAQPRSIGGRIGYGFDAAYQHSVGDNRISLEVGLPGFSGIEAAATYDWVFPINSWDNAGSWNWYAGVGAGVGYRWYYSTYVNPDISVGVAGRIGVEYNFEFPLTLSVDWRPIIGPRFDLDGGTYFYTYGLYGFGVSARYRF